MEERKETETDEEKVSGEKWKRKGSVGRKKKKEEEEGKREGEKRNGQRVLQTSQNKQMARTYACTKVKWQIKTTPSINRSDKKPQP